MSKKIRKILLFLIVFMVTVFSVKMDTKAAGGLSISASASKVSAGQTFTVTVKAAGNYFVTNISLNVSGGTVVSGLGKTSLDKGESTTAKIQLTGDACTVSVSGVGANYDTETEEAASASVTVKKKVVVVDTRSKDNTLSSLTVSAGTLSPGFSASTTSYNVTVDGATNKITLSASANHAKASVSGTGEKTLLPGHNTFVVVCTAENGSQKKYTVDVYMDETPLVYTTYNNQELGVVRNQTDIGIPATFEATTVLLGEQEVQAYRSNQFNMTLVYMVNGVGDKNFYIYEEETGITSVFRPVSILGRNVVVYDLTEEEQIRENMVYSEVTVDGVTLYGWTYENPDFANYIHILVMNEFGEKIIYQYETTENSLQLYREYVEVVEEEEVVEDVVEEPVEKWPNIPIDYLWYAVIGLVVLAVILIISLICLIATRKTRRAARKVRAQKKAEKKAAKEEKLAAKENAKAEKLAAKENAKAEKIAAKEAKKAAKRARKEE